MDELLQKAAEAMGMPPALAERSAQARAEKEGTTVEAVLREWAGEEAAPAAEPAVEAATDTADPAPAEQPTAAPSASAPTEVTTDYLVQLAAEAKRMPPKLVLSSAEARAKNAKQPVDEVLAAWAGVDLDELAEQVAAGTAPVPETPSAPATPAPAPTPDPAPAAAESPEPAAEPAAAAATAAVAMSMDELLEKVAEVKGMPAPLAKRSAEARSKKTGEPVEAVLAEWAGVDVSQVAAAGAVAPQPAASEAPQAPETGQGDAVDEAEPTGADAVEVFEPEAPDEPEDDEPELAAAASRSGYPTWLAAAFVIIPLLAVTYILVAPNGPDCGTAGQLKIDESTGLAVNCDGSDYGSSSVDFFSQGAALYTQCAACHGSGGEGGVGPAFSGGAVLATFPAGSCSDHVEWVTLGTANWPDATYGATNKPVGGVGVMPGYDGVLTPEQIAAVSLYERVQFGGQMLEEAEVDCGLVEGEGTEGGTDEMTEAAAP